MKTLSIPELFSKTSGVPWFKSGQKGRAIDLVEKIEDAQVAKQSDDKARKMSKSRMLWDEKRRARAMKAAQNFFGFFHVPIELLKAPTKEMAVRDFHKMHSRYLADQMYFDGVQYPIKPAVVCIYEVCFAHKHHRCHVGGPKRH